MFNINLSLIFENYNKGVNNSKLLLDLKKDISKNFKNKIVSISLNPFNKITFLNKKLGKYYVHEILLLEHELIQIYFYYLVKNKYKKFSDIGANVGLHTLLASQIFSEVRSFEPETNTFKLLNKNIDINNLNNVTTYNMAVSINSGMLKFLKNKENPTSNHLEISNVSDEYKSQYKNLDIINVKSESFQKILKFSDILKIDIEGHEGDLFSNINYNDLSNKILFIEIHNPKNSNKIINFYSKHKLKIKCHLIKDGIREITDTKLFPNKAKDGSVIFECE
ncbi:FkbM family methyltransferase [Alphaproteobacteria bacterium]|nr:FkbM family methyltransferase [Alphaproteobacteria bacterium]